MRRVSSGRLESATAGRKKPPVTNRTDFTDITKEKEKRSKKERENVLRLRVSIPGRGPLAPPLRGGTLLTQVGPVYSPMWVPFACRFPKRLCSSVPDTTPGLSHRRAEEPAGARRGSAVSNSAARVVRKRVAGNLTAMELDNAAIPTRSFVPPSTRGTRRSPVGSTAPAQKSERTSPHEASCLRSTGDRRKALSKGSRGKE